MASSKFQKETEDRFQRLQELLEKRMPLKYALAALDISEDEARKILNVPAGVELKDETIAVALVKFVQESKQRSSVMWHMLTDPKTNGGLVRTRQELGKVTRTVSDHSRRVDNLEAQVGKLRIDFDLLDQLLKGNLQEAFQAAAGNSFPQRTFIRTLRDKGVSDEQMVKAFSILREGDEEVDLDDADAFSQLFREFISFKEETAEKLTDHETRIVELSKDVAQVESSHKELREKVETVEKRITTTKEDSLPFIGVVIGSLAGFAVFLWVLLAKFGVTHTGEPSVQRTNKQIITTTHTESVLPWFPQWGLALLLGVGTAAVIMGVSALFAHSKTEKSETMTKTSESSDTPKWTKAKEYGKKLSAKRQTRKAKRAEKKAEKQRSTEEERQNGSVLNSGATSEPHDGETTVIPAVGEDAEPEKVGAT